MWAWILCMGRHKYQLFFSQYSTGVMGKQNFQWWFTKGNALGVGHSWNKHLHKVKWNKGFVTLWPCHFTWKSNSRQKKNYKNSNISPCKNYIIFKKNSLKETQNPSRYYNSVTNLKCQHKPKTSSFQKSSYKNRPKYYYLGTKKLLRHYTLIVNLNRISLPW